MRRIIISILLILCALAVQAQEKKDTTSNDTTLKGAKMKEVVVTKDKRLPIFVSPETKNMGPRVPSVSDIIGAKATDMIMHPFAFKQRKHDRRRKKHQQVLEEYSRVKTFDELLREAYELQMLEDSLQRSRKP